MGITISPNESEKDDYISFNLNGTYSSINNGKPESGIWQWNNNLKELVLNINQSNASIRFNVLSVNKSGLILLVEDESEKIKVTFKSKN